MRALLSKFKPSQKLDQLQAQLTGLQESYERLQKLVWTNTNGEMVLDHRFFVAGGDFISDGNFDFDAGMQVSGDFGDTKKKTAYTQMIARTLNNAGKWKAERDALAARVAEMREALSRIIRKANHLDVLDIARDAHEALATPDDSAAILARRDAGKMTEAADICGAIARSDAAQQIGVISAFDCEIALRARAVELAKAHG